MAGCFGPKRISKVERKSNGVHKARSAVSLSVHERARKIEIQSQDSGCQKAGVKDLHSPISAGDSTVGEGNALSIAAGLCHHLNA